MVQREQQPTARKTSTQAGVAARKRSAKKTEPARPDHSSVAAMPLQHPASTAELPQVQPLPPASAISETSPPQGQEPAKLVEPMTSLSAEASIENHHSESERPVSYSTVRVAEHLHRIWSANAEARAILRASMNTQWPGLETSSQIEGAGDNPAGQSVLDQGKAQVQQLQAAQGALLRNVLRGKAVSVPKNIGMPQLDGPVRSVVKARPTHEMSSNEYSESASLSVAQGDALVTPDAAQTPPHVPDNQEVVGDDLLVSESCAMMLPTVSFPEMEDRSIVASIEELSTLVQNRFPEMTFNERSPFLTVPSSTADAVPVTAARSENSEPHTAEAAAPLAPEVAIFQAVAAMQAQSAERSNGVPAGDPDPPTVAAAFVDENDAICDPVPAIDTGPESVMAEAAPVQDALNAASEDGVEPPPDAHFESALDKIQVARQPHAVSQQIQQAETLLAVAESEAAEVSSIPVETLGQGIVSALSSGMHYLTSPGKYTLLGMKYFKEDGQKLFSGATSWIKRSRKNDEN